jgi:hypothetical protein
LNDLCAKLQAYEYNRSMLSESGSQTFQSSVNVDAHDHPTYPTHETRRDDHGRDDG